MESFLSRVATSLAVAVAAIIFVAASVGFFGVALYLLLVPVMPAPLAAFGVGLAGLVLAGLIILVARMISRRSPVRRESAVADSNRASDINGIAAALGERAARELTSSAQAHPYRAAAVALLAGLAVGITPELRDILKGALKD